MKFTEFLTGLLQIRTMNGKDSHRIKSQRIREMVHRTQGSAIKFLDSRQKKALGVNHRTYLKAAAMPSEPLADSLDAVLAAHQAIKHARGPGSSMVKVQALGRIIATAPDHAALLADYYTTGTGRMGWSTKSLLQLLSMSGTYQTRPYERYRGGGDRVIKPMLASNLAVNPSTEYALEPKLDGVRVIVSHRAGRYQITSRAGIPHQQGLRQTLLPLVSVLGTQDYTVDGQLWVMHPQRGQGFQQLSRLVRAKHRSPTLNPAYWIFDMLQQDGLDLSSEPYHRRRQRLQRFMQGQDSPGVKLMPVVGRCAGSACTPAHLRGAMDSGWQGLILKDVHSPYRGDSRSRDWIKFKPQGDSVDVMIRGGRPGRGKRSVHAWGSFCMQVQCGDDYMTLGYVGTGFDDATLTQLNQRIAAHVHTIIQVKAQALVKSPRYDAGYALRFPSFCRIRADRTTPNTLAEVKRVFESN